QVNSVVVPASRLAHLSLPALPAFRLRALPVRQLRQSPGETANRDCRPVAVCVSTHALVADCLSPSAARTARLQIRYPSLPYRPAPLPPAPTPPHADQCGHALG